MQYRWLFIVFFVVAGLACGGCKKDGCNSDRESLRNDESTDGVAGKPEVETENAGALSGEDETGSHGREQPANVANAEGGRGSDLGKRGLSARYLNPELVQELQVRVGLVERAPPVIDGLILRSDIRQVTHYKGVITDETVPGRAVSADYNATRLALGNELGCALQRWSFANRQALGTFYEAYVATLVEGAPEARVDAASVLSTFAGVRMIVLKHLPSESMLQVSCSEALVSTDQLRELATRVLARL